MLSAQKILSRGLLTLVLVAIVGYAYFEARPFLSGPQLEVTSPQDGFSAFESPLSVTGEAHRISEITLNGNPIFVDENGRFERLVPLSPGYATIQVSVRDRFGRSKTLLLRGTYTPTAPMPFDIATSTPTTTLESLDADAASDVL
ncbi:MAG: hypothetical protein AMXMBFR44_6750 [Candidatus Campbellbacteria bacterium]